MDVFSLKGLDLFGLMLLYSAYLGGVAQLARALAWHARGQGFNSPHLHEFSFLSYRHLLTQRNTNE